MSNLMTKAMERLTGMLLNTDQKLKKMGETPYGVRKATPTEEREMQRNLTPEGVFQLIEEHGVPKVNAWLSKFKENK